jgi:hypothetical protein
VDTESAFLGGKKTQKNKKILTSSKEIYNLESERILHMIGRMDEGSNLMHSYIPFKISCLVLNGYIHIFIYI